MTKIELAKLKNYGLATMGERGQIVIPKEIRNAMKIKSGDKFLAFLRGDAVVAFIKPEKFDKLISEFASKLMNLKNIKQ